METRTPLTSTAAALIFSTCFPDAQADAPKLPVAVGLPTYELKRGARPTLVITRRFICCCLDLPLKELGYALGISFTTVKKLRIWSGLPCWPRRSIQVGKFPFLSFSHIRALRRQYMSCFDKDAPLLHVLQRVDRLVCGLPLEPPSTRPPSPAAPAPQPPSVLDELTDADCEGLPIVTEEELDQMCIPYAEQRPAPDGGLFCPWDGSSLLPPG